jgi:hypothetical protein
MSACQVFLAAVTGYIPSAMVQCIAAFMDACYIARRNAITAPALECFRRSVEQFQKLRNIFIETGVRATISLPRQHALKHFHYAIQFFGSPNGLCSSITESKHIKAVKEPWRRSSRFQALVQMLQTLTRMDKMAALHQAFLDCGMMFGTTSTYMAGIQAGGALTVAPAASGIVDGDDDEDEDERPEPGDSASGALSAVTLAARFRMLDFTTGLTNVLTLILYRIWLSTRSSGSCSIHQTARVSPCPLPVPLYI